jgi:hypothetical protein
MVLVRRVLSVGVFILKGRTRVFGFSTAKEERGAASSSVAKRTIKVASGVELYPGKKEFRHLRFKSRLKSNEFILSGPLILLILSANVFL